MSEQNVQVTQADREAAIPFVGVNFTPGMIYSDAYRIGAGELDEHPLVQAFARHRTRAEPDLKLKLANQVTWAGAYSMSPADTDPAGVRLVEAVKEAIAGTFVDQYGLVAEDDAVRGYYGGNWISFDTTKIAQAALSAIRAHMLSEDVVERACAAFDAAAWDEDARTITDVMKPAIVAALAAALPIDSAGPVSEG